MKNLPRLVRRSARVYEKLILAYPAAFRKKFAREMVDIFRDLTANAWRRRGLLGLSTTCFHVLVDLARTVPQEHVAEWKNHKGNFAMSLKSLMLRKFGPDPETFNPRWSQALFLVVSTFLMAIFLRKLLSMNLMGIELLFGILVAASMMLQGIAQALFQPLLMKNIPAVFKNSPMQIAIYTASALATVFGIWSLQWMVQTEYQLILGIMLFMDVMLGGNFIAAILPLVQAHRAQKIEPPQAKSPIADH
jgi:hypothetical protein